MATESKYRVLLSLICVIGITSIASAIPTTTASPIIPISAETLGRGATGIGIHNDVSDWLNNPALLPTSDLGGPAPWPGVGAGPGAGGNLWGIQGSGLFSSTDGAGDAIHNWGLNIGTRPQSANWGLGLGYDHFSSAYGSGNLYGLGAGWRPSSLDGFSFGASMKHWSITSGIGSTFSDSLTTCDLGMTYSPPTLRDSKGNPLFLGGIVLQDAFNQGQDWGYNRRVNLGASIQLAPNFRAATDEYGVGSRDRSWSKGLEYQRNSWTLRAGDWDGQGTFGLGYGAPSQPWRFDFAHTQKDGEKINMLTGTYTFNLGGTKTP